MDMERIYKDDTKMVVVSWVDACESSTTDFHPPELAVHECIGWLIKEGKHKLIIARSRCEDGYQSFLVIPRDNVKGIKEV